MVKKENAMKYCIRITDFDWYQRLMTARIDEVNFWTPGSQKGVNLERGELFLFKSNVKSEGAGKILGGGYFVRFEWSSIENAWEKYGIKNGCADIQEMKSKVMMYRASQGKGNNTEPRIGCIILNKVFFFEKDKWIAPPSNWGKPPKGHPVHKTFDTEKDMDAALFYKKLEAARIC